MLRFEELQKMERKQAIPIAVLLAAGMLVALVTEAKTKKNKGKKF